MEPNALDLILSAFAKEALVKAVFSKPADPAFLRTVLTPKKLGERTVLQAETFHADHKATHENVTPESADRLEVLCSTHRQINLFTTVGDCEIRRSASGKVTVIGGEKLRRALESPAPPKVMNPIFLRH